MAKIVTQLCPNWNLTHNLLIASPMPYRYVTVPPLGESWKINTTGGMTAVAEASTAWVCHFLSGSEI